jgi:hypothetical protein
MRILPILRIGVPIAAVCLCVQGQTPPSQTPPSQTPPPAKDLPIEAKGMTPRSTPTDYPDQGQAGKVTIGAEFQGHTVPTPKGNLTTEDYVTVETGLFGPPGTRIKLSFEDFALRINGKKTVPGVPYGVVLGNVKDPEWAPPEPAKSTAAHSNLTLGDDREQSPKGELGKEPVIPVKPPLEVQRALNQRVQKAALPQGDRALPVAGLVFFWYTGKVQKIHTIELIYTGPAGKGILTLEP